MNGEPNMPDQDVEFLESTRPFRGGVSLSFVLESARRVAKAYTQAYSEMTRLEKELTQLKVDFNKVAEENSLNKKLLDEARRIIALHQGK